MVSKISASRRARVIYFIPLRTLADILASLSSRAAMAPSRLARVLLVCLLFSAPTALIADSAEEMVEAPAASESCAPDW